MNYKVPAEDVHLASELGENMFELTIARFFLVARQSVNIKNHLQTLKHGILYLPIWSCRSIKRFYLIKQSLPRRIFNTR